MPGEQAQVDCPRPAHHTLRLIMEGAGGAHPRDPPTRHQRHFLVSSKAEEAGAISPRPPVECCQLTGVHPTHGQRLACGPPRPGRTCVPSIWTAVSAFGLSPRRARIVGATWVVSTEADST